MNISLKYISLFSLSAMLMFANKGFPQQQITLTQAIEIALKNNLDIQIAKNNITSASINNHIGVAGGLPTVTGTASTNEQLTGLNQELSNGTVTDRTSVASNNSNIGFTATMLLYNGGRVLATKKRLEELQHLNQDQLNVSIQGVIADVMLKYYVVVQQQNFVTTLKQSIEVSKQKLALIEARREAGLSNDAELFQAQLDLNAQNQALQSQNIVIELAKADLLRSLVMPPNSDIIIKDNIVVDKALQWENIQVSLKNHPSLLSAETQIGINKIIEQEAEARRMPTVNLSTGYNYTRSQSAAGFTLLNQQYGPFLGVNISVPIYTGTTNVRQVQIAKVNTENARLQKDVIWQNFRNTAAKAWESYTATLSLIDAEQQNYALAEKLLNVITQRFQLGQATIIDIKQAQQSFENSGYRLNNLSYNVKVAEITLKQLANQLGN